MYNELYEAAPEESRMKSKDVQRDIIWAFQMFTNVLFKCSGLREIVETEASSCMDKMHLQITTRMRPGGSKQGFPLMIICLRKNKTQQWQDWNTSEHTSINMDKHLRTTLTQPPACSFIAAAFTADASGVARRKLHCCPPRGDTTIIKWWVPKTCVSV